jgi:pimeloyl-ACP methyl ester carboxylesterase
MIEALEPGSHLRAWLAERRFVWYNRGDIGKTISSSRRDNGPGRFCRCPVPMQGERIGRMKPPEIAGLIAVGLTAAVAVIAARVAARYRREIRAARDRLHSLGSQLIETECGPVEYATHGEGYPVLVVHGIFGGFDQGLVIARGNVGEGFYSIAPSRFGYLRTPLPDDASPAGQADAFACLLDALNIQKAAILGTSAGGTSAIQFALRHPNRCSALVLFASNAPGEAEATLPPKPLAEALFKSDFIFWEAITYFSSNLTSMLGVPDGFELTPRYQADVAEVLQTILPVNPRADGALFDMFVSNPDVNTGYPLEEIAVPVLIINAVDDPLALYENAQAAAARISGSKLVTIESGGHMMLGHEERIRSEIAAFLEEHASN